MSFITRIILCFLMLCGNIASAQTVNYIIQDGDGNHLGHAIFIYTSTGYEVLTSKQKVSLRTEHGIATVTMGELVLTMQTYGTYWHGFSKSWQERPLTTSFGDKGVAKMFYAGKTTGGRLYYEEFWINNELFAKTQTVIDDNDHIIWSISRDTEGVIRIERM